MKANEIHLRASTLSQACIKVSALISSEAALAGYCRGELIRHASDLSIQSRGLMSGQLSSVFVERLNKCVDASNGCAFWLQQVINDKMMDQSIILPLVGECDQLSALFLGALKSANSKID